MYWKYCLSLLDHQSNEYILYIFFYIILYFFLRILQLTSYEHIHRQQCGSLQLRDWFWASNMRAEIWQRASSWFKASGVCEQLDSCIQTINPSATQSQQIYQRQHWALCAACKGLFHNITPSLRDKCMQETFIKKGRCEMKCTILCTLHHAEFHPYLSLLCHFSFLSRSLSLTCWTNKGKLMKCIYRLKLFHMCSM